MNSTGLLAILDHVYDFTIAVMLAAVCACAGNTICERLRVRFTSLGEELGFSLFVGTGAIGLSVLLFALAGWLRPLPIALLMLVFVVVTRGSWARLYARGIESIQRLGHSRETKIVATLYLALIAFLVLRAATPPTAADELIYHLSVTNDFVKHGRVYPMFDNSLGNFPFLIHMVYAVGMLAGSEIAARLFSLFLAVGTSFAIFGFCDRY